GLLAILKAGGAYVPLDPSYPSERLAYMVSDAQVSVLLTQQSFFTLLPEHQAQIVCLDSNDNLWSDCSQGNLTSEVKPSNLGYVIYTSGSTGKPKGVAMSQAALVNLLHWQQQETIVGQEARTLQFAPISFDVSFQEIFSTWCDGGTLVLVSSELRRDPLALIEFLTHNQVERLFLPFVALQQLASVASQCQNLPQLREVITAGEQLQVTPDLVEMIKRLPNCRLQNQYGPSESHVVSAYRLEIDADNWPKLPPIGRPIANTQLYVLSREQQPVPVGVPGELYIGGVGLANGYLDRQELTAEKFIPNPFENSKATKLYKTGDLARYLADGNIEFLGRLDHQVKVRGYRIETGEIEATLTQHTIVKETVVLATEDNLGNKRLVAYLVLETETPARSNPEVSETEQIDKVKQYLKDQLPEYMIPSGFVVLSQLPLTPSGKVDRKALPIPDNVSVSTEYVAPQTETQKVLAEIWAEVLGIEQVGIHDNFFDLGGHSLLATQLIFRIRQSLEQDVPLKTLFESPTITELEQALLKLENSSGYKSDVPLPTIVPAPEQRYQPFPLTEVQQAYWIGRSSDFELGNVATHGYMEFDCENLNIELLSRAWQQVIEHHDMLRAIILPDGQQQVLKEVPPYEIEVLDLREQSSETVANKLEAIRNQLSHEILPADQWPLFKIRATRLDEKLYRLHWSFDALLADAWSLIILWQQWLQLYQNPETILPKVELSFRDYIMGELSLKETPQYRRSQQYWFNRLDTLPPTPELPLVKPLSTLKQPRFISDSAVLSKTDWQQLKQRAKQANLTPSGVLLAAFADFLTCWSKSPKFTINLTLFNRLPLHPQVNEIVGDFTSLTLLEVNNSVTIPFQERAQRIQGQLWEDLDHRYISGVEVQRELRRHRGSYQPMGVIFTSTLALDSMNDGTPDHQSEEFPFLQLGEPVYSVTKTPQVWLDHGIGEQEGALILVWNVVEELFPEGLIEEMFNSYRNWLQQLATSDAAWSQTNLQLLPPAQLTQRIEVNQTTAPISEETLHSLFVKQVKQQGEAIALITPEYTLTYQELYTQAHKIGQKLQQLGATPNTLVAVLMTKGWEQVAAVLGIVMSGAAYLPIDPTLPQERQWHLLEQGEVKLALTQANLAGSLSLPEHIECLSVDTEEWETIEATPKDSVQSISDLAYVIFTSGSTGTPKGVMIDHRGAVNTILDINQRFDIKPNDRILAVSALNFDLSVYDIFGTLAAGGTIVIPSPDGAKDPAHWVELMVKHQVTLWNTVPALMQMLVEYLSQHPDCSSFPLRLALLSGDWIPLNLPEQIKTFWSQAQVMSLGGATEASIWSVYYPITTVDPEWKSIPYGKPLANQRLYVLNERMEPCPNWVPGQLYIGGIGIAQGYWRNEEKTNASFIIHPHTGEKLYKTGDLARYLPDGNTEFLGREDFQVKISGYRIELGEIEVSLQKHFAVKETVVTAVGELQNKQLVAYIVLHPETTATIDELREYLQQCLPEYMVPPNYIFLEVLPLTPNGKVDRKRLPTPELKFAPTTENYVPPRNSQELQLVKMWEDILGVQPVGVCSNFFDLGGHSLLAVRLMNRIEQELGRSLPLSTLFQSSTVEQLARILHQEQVVSDPSPLVPIQSQGSQLPIFCVHPAGGTVFCYFELAQKLGMEQPFYGLQSLGQVEGEEPLTSVEDMAAVYQKAIREVQAKGPYILMGWSFGGMVALEMANNLLAQGEQVAFLGLIDTYAPSQMPNEEQLSENVEVVLELFGGNLSLPWEEIRQLPQKEQVTLIWEQARQANLVPPDFETTQLERLLHIMKLNHKAMGSYSPPAYPGMITLFRAEAGSVTVSQELVGVDPTLGWKEVGTSGVEVHTIPGYHEYMVHQPNVAILAERLKSCIEKSLSTYQQNSSQ
ncbi:MAG: amino acid adenylation domain-containing protein, partial [Moorea sp. SIO3G5]|nr:amino acid adenylation domain-containing protein [Moorena sp. SIO3G5]